MRSAFFQIGVLFLFATTAAWGTPRGVQVTKTSFSQGVLCLLKDRSGFLWLGTYEGLYRYDGYTFEAINTVPIEGLYLSDPAVQDLLEDSLGYLWIATGNGVTVLNPARNRTERLLMAPDTLGARRNAIHRLLISGDQLWMSSGEGRLYWASLPAAHRSLRAQEPPPFKIWNSPGQRVRHLVAAPDGGVWVQHGRDLKKLSHLDTAFVVRGQIELPPEDVQSFRFLNDSTLLLGDIFGLKRLDVATGHLTVLHDYGLPDHVREGQRSKQLRAAPGGDFWLFGHAGVFGRVEAATETFVDYAGAFEAYDFDDYPYFLSLCQDRPDHLWVGRSGGLYEVWLRDPLFDYLQVPSEAGRGGTFFTRSFHALPDSSLLIGGNAGLDRYFPRDRTFRPLTFVADEGERTPLVFAYDFFQDGDTTLIASETHGLLFYDAATDHISIHQSRAAYEAMGPERSSVQWSLAVLKDHAGVTWLGHYGGLRACARRNGHRSGVRA
ncbi:MAG: two-component regulator propeller domain-containing protein [Catalinimonas sp.]